MISLSFGRKKVDEKNDMHVNYTKYIYTGINDQEMHIQDVSIKEVLQ